MKTIHIVINLFALFVIIINPLDINANTKSVSIETRDASFVLDKANNFKIVKKDNSSIEVKGTINSLWSLYVQDISTGKKYELNNCLNYKILKEADSICIVYDVIKLLGKEYPFNAKFSISVRNDSFCFSGIVQSNSENLIIRELDYPRLSEISIPAKSIDIFWPKGLGMKLKKEDFIENKQLQYPCARDGAMPWLSINSKNSGIYIGSHDVNQTSKIINLKYDDSQGVFCSSVKSGIYESKYKVPDVFVKIYEGQWYKASKFYRDWYDKHFTVAAPCDWVINDSGWLLAILKQQNGEVMWSYRDIDKLCDVAERFNLSTIGLFGWAVGGHDHLYPNYQPDNLMGGKEGLKTAIGRAHQRGIKIILYANGKIMDTGTDYYKYNGFQTMIVKEGRKPDIQFYVKQKNATPVIFAQACAGSELWRKTMLDLGTQALSLGADGILYDQLGVLNPINCFSTNHDHHPGQADSRYRLQMINKIRSEMKKHNPNFIVMTEATNDVVLRGIEYTHGWGMGTKPYSNVFPELFRYTFPELITTQRNPNPMITRTDANFAVLYGLRHEIETRYSGDVKYLSEETFTIDDYSNVVSPPSFEKMNSIAAKEAEKYLYDLIEFEKQNPEFFKQGKFIDIEGIKITGEDIIGKGFINGNKLGVVVWNTSETENRNFSLSVEGYRLLRASEPNKSKIESFLPLKSNSIRLLIFEKNEK